MQAAALGGSRTLPIPAEIDARLVRHRQGHDAVNLAAIRIAAMILAPGGFLREPREVRAGNVVVMADFAAPHPAEKALRPIRARAVQAVSLGMVDPVHRVASVKRTKGSGR